MTEPTGQRRVPWEGFIGRGAVAGAIGGLAFAVGGEAYNWWRYSALSAESLAVAAIFAPVTGVIMGSAVGAVIWKMSEKMIGEPTALFRFLIGMSVVAFSSLFARTAPAPATLVLSVFLGGLPGLAARPKRVVRAAN